MLELGRLGIGLNAAITVVTIQTHKRPETVGPFSAWGKLLPSPDLASLDMSCPAELFLSAAVLP